METTQWPTGMFAFKDTILFIEINTLYLLLNDDFHYKKN